jgi:stage V sporulation protein D (sporulation-specific penicillin-binding protein)
MMRDVVLAGTGQRAALDGYQSAGKTGTAQKAGPTGGYDPGCYVASFAGFAPADEPAVVLLVSLDEPRGEAYHGGQVAAPVFARIMQPVLTYLGVPPDDPERVVSVAWRTRLEPGEATAGPPEPVLLVSAAPGREREVPVR